MRGKLQGPTLSILLSPFPYKERKGWGGGVERLEREGARLKVLADDLALRPGK